MRIPNKVLVCAVGSLLAGAALAQSWPTRPVRVLVGYNAGTSPDLVSRITGTEIGKRLGQQLVVENRPGAGGHLANVAVSRAEPDGYTILTAGLPFNSHPIFIKTDTVIVGKELTPLGDVANTPIVLLSRGALGIKTLDDLVAYHKANPGKLNYGAVSTQNDLVVELVRRKLGVTWTSVPYKGAPVQEMLRGDVDLYVGTMTGLATHVQSGKISTVLFFGRHPDYPNGVLATDLGLVPRAVGSQLGYYGPPKLPREIVDKFSQAALAASKTPEVVDALRKLGLQSGYQRPEEQQRDYDARAELIGEAARLTNFKPE